MLLCFQGPSCGFQDMRKLREGIKTSMAMALRELQSMQQLEDNLETAEVVSPHS